MSTGTVNLCLADGLLDSGLRSIAYEIFRAQSLPTSTLYLPVKDLGTARMTEKALSRHMAPPVAHLLQHYCASLLSHARTLFSGRLDGLEIWTNAAERHDDNVLIHVDNDEWHRKRTGKVRSPLFGSVLHLGPAAGISHGGTFFALQARERVESFLFRPTPWTSLPPEIRDGGLLVPFRAGRAILFDGSIPHCITPFGPQPEGRERVTLLVNGWQDPIELG